MPRVAKFSKIALADRLANVFENSGYDGASLAMLAEAAALSKASLYHHFPKGKEDMAAHVLMRAGARLQRLVLDPLHDDDSPALRLQASLEGTAEYYAGSVPVCLMNSLLLGDGAGLFRVNIQRAVEIWKKALGDAYHDAGVDWREAEAWAAYAVERIQGALVLCRVRQSRLPLDECLEELKSDVELAADT